MLTEYLKEMDPERLHVLHQRLTLVGAVLAQISLLEVVADKNAADNSKVQAAKVLTSMGGDPQILAQQLKASPLADKSPEELREMVESLRSEETLDKLAKEED